ncbi:MAG: hypothetical protein GX131_16205 [candidate division WS1 bacterium]|jgi:hypothetical protein|nr:hypothetical protein [candidate division WS1 bacterium]
MYRMTAIALLIILAAPGAWAELQILDEPLWVFPGQIFRIALGQPAGSGALAVEHPANVEMFDRWDQDERQRFYFRALEPGETPISFAGAGGELTITVPVIPWSSVYEAREYSGIALPRLWPVGADLDAPKFGRTIYSDAEVERMRTEGGEPGALAQRWAAMSDEQVWSIIPGPAIPRTCLMVLGSREPDAAVGKGCPVCGMAIYEGRSGFYPWVFDPEHPWKVKCPECQTLFPSNDWHEGDMHSGPFPDDGWGCEPLEPIAGKSGEPWRWPFIAYYHQTEAYMRAFTPGIMQSAEAYVRTGDAAYAHKCGVALARFAQSHLDMSLNLNHRKLVNRDGVYRGPVGAPIRDRFNRVGSSFSYIQPNWDTPRMEEAMRAYDLVFDAISEDEELVAFVRAQYHPEIETPADLHRFLQAGIIRTCAQYGIDNATARNWPMQERMVATMALGLGQPQSMELVDHLLNGWPGLRYSLTNQYLKDGGGHETGGYNRIQVRYMAGLADIFSRIERMMPDLYQPPKFISLTGDPKFRQIFDFHLNTSLIGRVTDETGDAGAPSTDLASPRQGKPLTQQDFAEAFAWTGVERFAQAAWGPGGAVPGAISDPQVAAEIERIGREQGWQVDLESDVLDGYGHAILRSGEGDRQRALWVRYGVAVQHLHNDMLTMGLAALGRNPLPELGYPVGWTYAGAWEKNWGAHYGTHITGVSPGAYPIGSVQTFASDAPAQYARARSEVPGDEPRAFRERAIVLVDIDAHDAYAVSIERVFGGEEHTHSFHGPSGPATVTGANLHPQGGGTVAGPDVPWRDISARPSGDAALVCLAFMPDPMVGEVSGPFEASFELEGQEGVFLHTTHLAPDDSRLWTSACTAPGGRSPYRATWCVMQRSGEAPLASQFATIIEPSDGERRVLSVTELAVEGGGEDTFASMALRIETAGFTDTLVIQPSGGATCSVEGGLSTDGEFALWRERDGAMITAKLVRGTALHRGETGISLARAEYTGTIESFDPQARTIRVRMDGAVEQRLTAEVPGGEGTLVDAQFSGMSDAGASALVGRFVHISNEGGNRATQRIMAAEAVEGGLLLTLQYDPRVAEGPVEEIADGALTSGATFKLNRYGYYDGKTLANEDASASWRIAGIEGNVKPLIDTAHEGEVSAEVLRSAFTDRDGDGIAGMVLYDYGPGDTITIPCQASVSRR